MAVRVIDRDEWELWRRLRLEALADAPDAFCESLDDMADEPDTYWHDIVASTVDHERGYLAVAEVDGDPCGTVFARLTEGRDIVDIGAMWIAPAARRTGLGADLLAAALDWGASRGARRAELWVTGGNSDAERLYRNAGFSLTGARGHLREDSDLEILAMAKPLVDG